MKRWGFLLAAIVLCMASVTVLLGRRVRLPEDAVAVDTAPRIEPDYSGLTIPFNIAPLNFNIRDKAQKYIVSIYPAGDSGSAINIASGTGSIRIDRKKWRRMLEASKGEEIIFAVFTQDTEGKWIRYGDVVNTVSEDPIPGYLAYRYMKPTCSWWHDIEILQQSLETSAISTIIKNASCVYTCVNCHSFSSSNPRSMALGFRSYENGVGTILYSDGELKKISTKWGYTSWHPSGRIAAYSMNKVRQFFHGATEEIRDVVDLDSAIACYSFDKSAIVKVPALAGKDDLETYPHFSPDGKYLYFCSAPILWQDRDTVPPKQFRDIRYSIMRIGYDVDSDVWGEVETVLSAEETGKSMLIPRISPDGRYMVFCMCDYGCFPIYQPSSDLYVMDLHTKKYWLLEILNSPHAESWHNYSNCGRWMVFSSKSQGGLFTRPYFSYIDENGSFHKPFVMPQRNPEHYYNTIQTYSVPEFLESPVEVSPKIFAQILEGKENSISVYQPISGATKTKVYGRDAEQYERE